jgi:hypothetical protein
MKKIFLVTGIAVATTFTVTFAQDNIDENSAKVVKSVITDQSNEIQKEGGESNQNTVSESTKNQFTADFPDATNIRFERTKDFDEVSYSQSNRDLTAYYDFNDQLVGTIHYISFRDLPVNAQVKISDKYPNYKVVKALRFDVNSDNESYLENYTYMTLYGNSFEATSNYFVELKNESKGIVLKAELSGEVSFFTAIR